MAWLGHRERQGKDTEKIKRPLPGHPSHPAHPALLAPLLHQYQTPGSPATSPCPLCRFFLLPTMLVQERRLCQHFWAAVMQLWAVAWLALPLLTLFSVGLIYLKFANLELCFAIFLNTEIATHSSVLVSLRWAGGYRPPQGGMMCGGAGAGQVPVPRTKRAAASSQGSRRHAEEKYSTRITHIDAASVARIRSNTHTHKNARTHQYEVILY